MLKKIKREIESMEQENNKTNNVGFCDLLTILFIAFKLLGIINWSWWWVLAPLWVPIALAIVAFIIVLIIAFSNKIN